MVRLLYKSVTSVCVNKCRLLWLFSARPGGLGQKIASGIREGVACGRCTYLPGAGAKHLVLPLLLTAL